VTIRNRASLLLLKALDGVLVALALALTLIGAVPMLVGSGFAYASEVVSERMREIEAKA
jgi:acyl-coenzyme A synthetase/AMP-(fatty) acid ligase